LYQKHFIKQIRKVRMWTKSLFRSFPKIWYRQSMVKYADVFFSTAICFELWTVCFIWQL